MRSINRLSGAIGGLLRNESHRHSFFSFNLAGFLLEFPSMLYSGFSFGAGGKVDDGQSLSPNPSPLSLYLSLDSANSIYCDMSKGGKVKEVQFYYHYLMFWPFC